MKGLKRIFGRQRSSEDEPVFLKVDDNCVKSGRPVSLIEKRISRFDNDECHDDGQNNNENKYMQSTEMFIRSGSPSCSLDLRQIHSQSLVNFASIPKELISGDEIHDHSSHVEAPSPRQGFKHSKFYCAFNQEEVSEDADVRFFGSSNKAYCLKDSEKDDPENSIESERNPKSGAQSDRSAPKKPHNSLSPNNLQDSKFYSLSRELLDRRENLSTLNTRYARFSQPSLLSSTSSVRIPSPIRIKTGSLTRKTVTFEGTSARDDPVCSLKKLTYFSEGGWRLSHYMCLFM